jgi:hypothetical protein
MDESACLQSTTSGGHEIRINKGGKDMRHRASGSDSPPDSDASTNSSPGGIDITELPKKGPMWERQFFGNGAKSSAERGGVRDRSQLQFAPAGRLHSGQPLWRVWVTASQKIKLADSFAGSPFKKAAYTSRIDTPGTMKAKRWKRLVELSCLRKTKLPGSACGVDSPISAVF